MSDDNIPALGFRGNVTAAGWELPPDLTEQEWWEAGAILGRVSSSFGWWLGDWWNAYKPKWGNRAEAALTEQWQKAGLPAYKTCVNVGSVASRFQFARRRATLSFHHHSEVAGIIDAAERERLLDWAQDNGASIRQLRAELFRYRRTHKLREMVMPNGQYAILMADPPWRYEHPASDTRAIENQYPTMDLGDLLALPIANLAGDDAVLYLWGTAPKLDECIKVLQAWDFTYRTNLVWVKDKIGMGYYARSQHELLLIAKRGELPTPLPEDRQSSVVFAERGQHSEKPVVFYEMIERWYPDLPKLELFARTARDGWDAWGNQVADSAA